MTRIKLLLFVTVAVVISFQPPAFAGPPWANDRQMRDEADAWRNSFIYDPGRGNGITLEQFASSSFVSYYKKFGFDRNFMIWAPLDRFGTGQTAKWAYCASNTLQPHLHAFCPGGTSNVAYKAVKDIILDRSIRAKHWPLGSVGTFISVYCGNFSTSPQDPGPMPVISGTKYLDCNRNGMRDPGEPGIPDWRIELWFEGSMVAETRTDESGNYRFELNANAWPITGGKYEVREETRPEFIQTETPGPIDVPLGAADRIFGGNDFGNFLKRRTVCSATALVVLETRYSTLARDPCSPATSSLVHVDTSDVPVQLPIRVTADAVSAETDSSLMQDQPGHEAEFSNAAARVARVTLDIGGLVQISASVLESEVAVRCSEGHSILLGSSRVAGLNVAGAIQQSIDVDTPTEIHVGQYTLYLNQRLEDERSLTMTALRLEGPDGTLISAGESSASFDRDPCSCSLP
jgi:SdrD B-like protein